MGAVSTTREYASLEFWSTAIPSVFMTVLSSCASCYLFSAKRVASTKCNFTQNWLIGWNLEGSQRVNASEMLKSK